ncbi:MAG TPA: tetratricopeptide repeat protein [Gemmatimonadaceae bacterium]|jgi:predicted negative regulator of RcsB-dependent stress response
MTSTRPDADSAAADHAQTFIDWTRVNAKALTTGATVVVVAAAAFWFYDKSRAIKQANAEKALSTAKQSIAAGNAPLAQTDLQKVYSQYGSTEAGVEAAMLLAQLNYDAGKYQDGITLLEKASGSGAAATVQSTLKSLEGDGYAQMGKLTDAGKQYEDAAAATNFEAEKAFQLSKAARIYSAAGDTARSRQLWSQMATDPKLATMSTEARVRLGELTAAVAKK